MSRPAAREPLDPTRIVDAAIEIADAQGLDAASMRKVAESLRVTPMALYKHLANRDDLVDRMVDRLLEGVEESVEGREWRGRVRARILGVRATLARHPWAREAVESRTLASPRALAHMDALISDMLDGGLSADLVHHAMHALSIRMWGFTRDVMPTPVLPEDPAQRDAALAGYASTYPGIIRMATTATHAAAGCDEDAEFEFAIDLLLDGVERLHRAGWSPVPAT